MDLYAAVRNNDLERFKRGLIKGGNAEKLLHDMLWHHADRCLKWYLKEHAENRMLLYFYNPLLVAIETGDMEKAAEVLNKHMDAKYPEGDSVAHGLAVHGYLELFQQMCAANPAQCAAVGYNDRHPIHLAVIMGHLDIVKYIMDIAPGEATAVDRYSNHPIHIACESGHIDIVKYIMDIAPGEITAVDGHNADHPIHIACESGHIDIVKHILDISPGEVTAVDEDGIHPIHYACESESGAIVKYILSIAPGEVLSPPSYWSDVLAYATPTQYAAPFYLDPDIPHDSLSRASNNQCAFLFNVPPIAFHTAFTHAHRSGTPLIDYAPYFDTAE